MTSEEPALLAQDRLEAFAALAAHQLGEAIALMRGAVVVLDGQHADLGAGGQDAMRAMRAGGDRAQRYVDDLLDVVRAGGEPPADPPPTDLDAALDFALAELEPFLRRGPVSVQREPLPAARLEAGDARRIVLHLVRGALAAGATRLGVTGRVGGDVAILEVFDNGAPVVDVAHCFEPFALPRGRGPLVGAGVGLAVARRLAERAGGRIAMEVRADGATIVTVEVPAP